MFRHRVWARAQGIAAMHRNYNIAIEFSAEGRLNKISISRERLPFTPARQPATDCLPSSPLSDQSRLTPWFRKTAPMTPVDNHSRPQSTPRSYRHHQLMDRSHEHSGLRYRASSVDTSIAQFARVSDVPPSSPPIRETRTANFRSSASCSSFEGCMPKAFSTWGVVQSPMPAQAMTPIPNRARVLGARPR